MKILSWKCQSLAVALAAASALALAAPAFAEKPDGGGGPRSRTGRGACCAPLFGGPIRSRPVYAPYDPYLPRAQREPRGAAPKVDAPSYYDYKADALVRVDFTALKAPAVPEKADFQP